MNQFLPSITESVFEHDGRFEHNASMMPATPLVKAAQNSLIGSTTVSIEDMLQQRKRQQNVALQNENLRRARQIQEQRQVEKRLHQQQEELDEKRVYRDNYEFELRLQNDLENKKIHNRLTHESYDLQRNKQHETVEVERDTAIVLQPVYQVPRDFARNINSNIANSVNGEFMHVYETLENNKDILQMEVERLKNQSSQQGTINQRLEEELQDLRNKYRNDQRLRELQIREVQFNIARTLPSKKNDYQYKQYDYLNNNMLFADGDAQRRYRQIRGILRMDGNSEDGDSLLKLSAYKARLQQRDQSEAEEHFLREQHQFKDIVLRKNGAGAYLHYNYRQPQGRRRSQITIPESAQLATIKPQPELTLKEKEIRAFEAGIQSYFNRQQLNDQRVSKYLEQSEERFKNIEGLSNLHSNEQSQAQEEAPVQKSLDKYIYDLDYYHNRYE